MGYVGIDLGTTFCSCAYARTKNDEPHIVSLHDQTCMESIICISEDGGRYLASVGKDAQSSLENSILTKENVVFIRGAKRNIGLALPPDAKSPPWRIGELQIDPITASALILKKIKSGFDAINPEKLTRAVITHPAYFSAAQKAATREAASLAGIEVLDTITEPAAAAIAFGLQNCDPGYYMIFDLGGGTLDVTIMEVHPDKINMIVHHGDARLGGLDWDKVIFKVAKEKFLHNYPDIDPVLFTGGADHIWLHRAREQKETLTQNANSVFRYDLDYGDQTYTIRLQLSREQFETMTSQLLYQAIDIAETALANGGLSWDRLKGVVPVGGATHMPAIQNALRSKVLRVFSGVINPAYAVALGAAYRAMSLEDKKIFIASSCEDPASDASSEKEPASAVLTTISVNDCTAHSLAVLALDRKINENRCFVIIPKGSTLPCKGSQRFYLEQRTLEIQLYEGEDSNPRFCKHVGSVIIDDIPPKVKPPEPIELVFSMTEGSSLFIEVLFLNHGIIKNATYNFPSRFLQGTEQSREEILSKIFLRK